MEGLPQQPPPDPKEVKKQQDIVYQNIGEEGIKALNEVSKETGVPVQALIETIYTESKGRKDLPNEKSSATGVFQVIDDTKAWLIDDKYEGYKTAANKLRSKKKTSGLSELEKKQLRSLELQMEQSRKDSSKTYEDMSIAEQIKLQTKYIKRLSGKFPPQTGKEMKLLNLSPFHYGRYKKSNAGDSYILYKDGETEYENNKPLDRNKDGTITYGEI